MAYFLKYCFYETSLWFLFIITFFFVLFFLDASNNTSTAANATARQLGLFGFPPHYPPSFGGLYPPPLNSFQPFPSYGGYPPTLTPFEPYIGAPPPLYQQQSPFGVGTYPGSNPYGPSNGLYGGLGGAPQAPYYQPDPISSYQPTSYPSNSFNPSYGYPSNAYKPQTPGSYNPITSAVTAQNPYQPTGVNPDPFSPVVGPPSFASSPSVAAYNPVSQQLPYKPITIIESSPYYPSSSSSLNGYKPSSGSQDGYDSVSVSAPGYDTPSSYKPSGGYKPVISQTYYKPPSSGYRPSSYPVQSSYRPTVQGSIQEIPNGPLYYPGSSQNRPTFYSASDSEQVMFPRE